MKKYPKNFKFERVCPSCMEIIKYKSYQGYETGLKRNSKCRKCGCGWMKGQTKENNESVRKMSEKVSNKWKENFNNGYEVWNKGLTKDNNIIVNKMSEKRKGKKHSEEVKKIISFHSKMRWEQGVYDNQYGKNYKEFKKYQHKVHKLTHKIKNLIEGFDESKHGKMGVGGAYQIDHIIDIKFGFYNNIPAEEIADLKNLQFIPWEENLKKGYYGKSKN
jgi:hypothetical protein